MVAAKDNKNMVVTSHRVALNIFLHCLVGPAKNIVPAILTALPKEYTRAKVLRSLLPAIRAMVDMKASRYPSQEMLPTQQQEINPISLCLRVREGHSSLSPEEEDTALSASFSFNILDY